MRKFITAAVLIGFIGLGIGASPSCASEIDLLLQKLVEKGILTPGEAQQIGIETKEQVKKEISQTKYELLPEWLQKVKFKGDFRLRYQWDKDKGQDDDNRARIRVRLGSEVKVNDQMKIGIGIATGKTSDPRSTNVTLGNSSTTDTPASFKDIILDYGYGQYNPTSWLTFTAGKFKNILWQPTDLLWDSDLNPEGASAQFDYRLNPKINIFANTLYFWLRNDTRSDKQPMMFAIQPGINYNITDKIGLKAALADYIFIGVKGTSTFSKWATNSATPGTTGTSRVYQYNYNSLNPSFELSLREPFAGLNARLASIIPFAGIFGDYIYNYSPEVDSSKDGWDMGLKFGHEKVGDWGQWQAKVMYSKLGRDAFLDIFPDSDRYNGKTNMKSLEAIYEFGLGKNTSLSLDYYYSKSLTQASEAAKFAPQQVLQVDWNLKW